MALRQTNQILFDRLSNLLSLYSCINSLKSQQLVYNSWNFFNFSRFVGTSFHCLEHMGNPNPITWQVQWSLHLGDDFTNNQTVLLHPRIRPLLQKDQVSCVQDLNNTRLNNKYRPMKSNQFWTFLNHNEIKIHDNHTWNVAYLDFKFYQV